MTKLEKAIKALEDECKAARKRYEDDDCLPEDAEVPDGRGSYVRVVVVEGILKRIRSECAK